ncbi:unnamed protein product, partial [Protopolystoma xenopodis]
MLNTHPYVSSRRFYGNGSSFVFSWVNVHHSERIRKVENQSSSGAVLKVPENELNRTSVQSAYAEDYEGVEAESGDVTSAYNDTFSLPGLT